MGVHEKIILFGRTRHIHVDVSTEEGRAMLHKLPFIILPESLFRRIWNVILIILLIFTAIWVPYKVAFVDTDPVAMDEFELLIDSLFMLDLIINFISAYEDSDTGMI